MVSVELVRKTRPVTSWAVGCLCLWGFGNLYEANKALGSLLRGPSPGALAGAFDAGSPFYYFMPWTALALVLVVTLAVRLRAAPRVVATRLRLAAGAVAIAAVLTALLVSLVNPAFRDPAVTDGLTRLLVVWWTGNLGRLVCVAIAVWGLLSWRRIELIDGAFPISRRSDAGASAPA